MERKAIESLILWKNSEDRKPLIVKGARQVGKTWLMKEFGRRYYDDTFYFNFDEEEELASVFQKNKNPERIIDLLGMISGKKIEPGKHLIIFDEVQECSDALNCLKYFYENAPQYQIVAAGSLLGVALHHGTSFPVGKVDFMDLYPLSFKEFLCAVGKENLATLLSAPLAI